jgi:hypothetical protein
MEKRAAVDPMQPTPKNEPIEQIEQAEPIEPIERIEPCDAIERMEFSDPIDHLDAVTGGLLTVISVSFVTIRVLAAPVSSFMVPGRSDEEKRQPQNICS